MVRSLFKQVITRGLSCGLHRFWDLAGELIGAHLIGVCDRLHLYEVNNSGEIALSANRQLNRNRVGTETIDHRLHALIKVCAGAVHLVDVSDPRNGVLVGLTPDRLGLRLNAGYRVEEGNRAVEDAQ